MERSSTSNSHPIQQPHCKPNPKSISRRVMSYIKRRQIRYPILKQFVTLSTVLSTVPFE